VKISRSGARATSPEASIKLNNVNVAIKHEAGSAQIIFNANDVADFGTNKTHHNYIIEISLEEFVLMVESLSSCDEQNAAHIRESLSPKLNKLIRLVNMCAV